MQMTEKKLQASYEHRLVHDSDSLPEDSGGRNTRHESVARTREQLNERIVRLCQREGLWRPSGSCGSISYGGALWITRRPSQLESEPCEAGRNNPSRRRVFTRLKTDREKPGKAKNCATLMGNLLTDVGAQKTQIKFKDGFLWFVNEQMASTYTAPMMMSLPVYNM